MESESYLQGVYNVIFTLKNLSPEKINDALNEIMERLTLYNTTHTCESVSSNYLDTIFSCVDLPKAQPESKELHVDI